MRYSLIRQLGPSASAVIGVKGHSENVIFSGVDDALSEADTELRLFGKPEVQGERRMDVCLAKGSTIEDARKKANRMASKVTYSL